MTTFHVLVTHATFYDRTKCPYGDCETTDMAKTMSTLIIILHPLHIPSHCKSQWSIILSMVNLMFVEMIVWRRLNIGIKAESHINLAHISKWNRRIMHIRIFTPNKKKYAWFETAHTLLQHTHQHTHIRREWLISADDGILLLAVQLTHTHTPTTSTHARIYEKTT